MTIDYTQNNQSKKRGISKCPMCGENGRHVKGFGLDSYIHSTEVSRGKILVIERCNLLEAEKKI